MTWEVHVASRPQKHTLRSYSSLSPLVLPLGLSITVPGASSALLTSDSYQTGHDGHGRITAGFTPLRPQHLAGSAGFPSVTLVPFP